MNEIPAGHYADVSQHDGNYCAQAGAGTQNPAGVVYYLSRIYIDWRRLPVVDGPPSFAMIAAPYATSSDTAALILSSALVIFSGW